MAVALMAKRPVYGECPRCGFKIDIREAKREWTGQRVCKDCYDPRPADTKPPRYKPEGLPRPDAMPQTEIIEGPSHTDWDDV